MFLNGNELAINMKLHLLFESREYVKLFHGTGNKNVITQGLLPYSPNQNLKKAIFFTPDIELALYYALAQRTGEGSGEGISLIVEVLINKRNTQLVSDEEHFPLDILPQELPNETNKKYWEKFWKIFDEYFPEPNDAEKYILLKGIADSSNGTTDTILDAVRKIFLRRKFKASGEGWMQNRMLIQDQHIAFRGRNKIIGIYEFEYDDESDDESDDTDVVCTKVWYSNGGSVKLGDKFESKQDWQ